MNARFNPSILPAARLSIRCAAMRGSGKLMHTASG